MASISVAAFSKLTLSSTTWNLSNKASIVITVELASIVGEVTAIDGISRPPGVVIGLLRQLILLSALPRAEGVGGSLIGVENAADAKPVAVVSSDTARRAGDSAPSPSAAAIRP